MLTLILLVLNPFSAFFLSQVDLITEQISPILEEPYGQKLIEKWEPVGAGKIRNPHERRTKEEKIKRI